MEKVRNISFVIICFLLFSSVLGYLVAEKTSVLPETIDNGSRSYVEGRELQESFPQLSPSTFIDRSFQDTMEQYVSDKFPKRDEVLLVNAAFQKTSIEAANLVFNFDQYPTYFGSNIAYDREFHALFEIPQKNSAERQTDLAEIGKLISNAAQASEITNFVVYFPDRAEFSLSNPTNKYINNVFDTKVYDKNFTSSVSEYVTVIIDEHASTEEWLTHYFATDHHWKISGAYQAYLSITSTLGYTPLQVEEALSLQDYSFCGMFCRKGLCFLENRDHLEEYRFDTPPYLIMQDGRETQRSELVDGLNNLDHENINTDSLTYNGYFYLFGPTLSSPLIYYADTNTEAKNLLVITDSFGCPVEPMLASHYAETHVIYPASQEDPLNFYQYVEMNNITDVIILAGANNLLSEEFRLFFTP